MNAFDGQAAAGNWRLEVQDRVSGTTNPAGTLVAWELSIQPVGGPLCEPFDCVGDPLPGDVGPTLFLAKENGTDLRFDWGAVAGAEGYRVWSSDNPQFMGQRLFATGTGATLLAPDGLAGPPGTTYYLVRATNSCEWEGP
jgi:hypothetical protein